MKKAGEITSALSDDCAKAMELFCMYLQSLSQNLVQLVGGTIFALAIRWSVTLFQLTGVVLMVFVVVAQGVVLSKIASLVSVRTGEAVSTANEVITSMRTVRSMAGEEKEVDRYSKQLEKVQKLGYINAIVKGIGFTIIYFLFHAAQAIGFWWGAVELGNGDLSIGSFIKVYGMVLIAQLGLFEVMGILPELFKSQSSISKPIT